MNEPMFDKKRFEKELINTYRRIFSGTIKETFLVKMLKRVERDPRYGTIFLNTFNPNEALSTDALVRGENSTTVNICKMIMLNHYINTVCLPDQERGKKQEEESYQEKLTNQVLKMYSIERLADSEFSISSVESYLPLLYYASTLNNYCAYKYNEIIEKGIPVDKRFNDRFAVTMLSKLITRVTSCIKLADLGATDELIIIYRSLIELFMTFAVLFDQDESVINKYYEFDQATFDYNRDATMPDKYKLAAKKARVQPVKYLNYGWVMALSDYTNEIDLGICGLARIIDKKCDKFYGQFGNMLQTAYRMCNPQTHGTSIWMNNFELELYVFQNIALIIRFYARVMSEVFYRFDLKMNGLDLLEELRCARNESSGIYEWLHKDQVNLEKTNADYKNRMICSARLK